MCFLCVVPFVAFFCVLLCVVLFFVRLKGENVSNAMRCFFGLLFWRGCTISKCGKCVLSPSLAFLFALSPPCYSPSAIFFPSLCTKVIQNPTNTQNPIQRRGKCNGESSKIILDLSFFCTFSNSF